MEGQWAIWGACGMRILLTVIPAVYIRLQAESYGGLRRKRYKKTDEPRWRRLLLLDVLKNAKEKRGWVKFFFCEYLLILFGFTAINLFCTVSDLIHGEQTNLSLFLSTGIMLGATVAHFLIFFILDEIFNKNWWDQSTGES